MEKIEVSDLTSPLFRRLILALAITVIFQCGFLGVHILALQLTTQGLVRLCVTILLTAVTVLAVGTTIFLIRALSQLAANHSDAASTRGELIGAAAAARERQRLARDLHDLISHGVSTIALKAEVAYRAAADTARTRQELREIVRLSGEVLTEIRRISHRHRRMSLDAELESVVSTLTGLGVEVTADISHEKLNPDTSTVLAIVLREGVTNLLRHGRGRRCEIRTRSLNGTVVMILSNDCVPAPPGDAAAVDGSGLENLAARVAAVNGRFHADRSGDRFILGVEIPQDVFTQMSSD